MDCSMLGSLPFTFYRRLLKLVSIESVMPINHLIVCHPLFLLPSIFPSIRVSPNESILHIRWSKYWGFSFSICPSNEYSELISFRIDCFYLLTIHGTLKSLLQHYSLKVLYSIQYRVSVQFSHSDLSDSLWSHGLQYTRLPCPSLIPGAYSNSCPLSRWCHPTISSLSSPSPAFNISQHQGIFQWVSGGQSIGASASASVLPMNIQDWFPLGWTGWISLQSKGLSRVFSNTTVQKHQFFNAQLSLWSNSHIHTWLLEKP